MTKILFNLLKLSLVSFRVVGSRTVHCSGGIVAPQRHNFKNTHIYIFELDLTIYKSKLIDRKMKDRQSWLI